MNSLRILDFKSGSEVFDWTIPQNGMSKKHT